MSPRPRHTLGPRALHFPVGHASDERLGGTRGCFVVLPRPLEGAGWRLTASGLVPFERGRQHKNQPQRHHPTSQQPTRIACRPFGGRARSQPAGTIQTPLTRPHVPAFPTPPWQPHPASPQAGGQMEHGRRRSNTAGRETKGTDREGNHHILHQHRREKREQPGGPPSNPPSTPSGKRDNPGGPPSNPPSTPSGKRDQPGGLPSNPPSTLSRILSGPARRLPSTPTIFPRRLMSSIPLTIKRMAKHPRATSEGTNPVINWCA